MTENYKLRKPTGLYNVGCKQFIYEYESEKLAGKKRIIPCLCFYPAKISGNEMLKKYVSIRILPEASGVEANSYNDAPIIEGKYPLLLFNHGFSVGLEANTIQCEELASQGYIILSIGHPDDGSYELPGGEILLFDKERFLKDFQAESEAGLKISLKYAAWQRSVGKEASISEYYKFHKKLINAQPKMVAQSEVWIKDSQIALELFLMETGQTSSEFSNYVDKENIGTFGMSFGGSIALSLAQEEKLIKASANLDGFFYSASWQQPVQKPILLMQNDSVSGLFLTFPYLNAENDAYLVTVQNSTHGNFMDYNEIVTKNPISKEIIDGEEIEFSLLGKIDPSKMETILNSFLVDFFDKYLKNKYSQVIDASELPAEIVLQRKAVNI